MFTRRRIFGCVLVALCGLFGACRTTIPLDESARRFIVGNNYATTNYQTTFYTTHSERIVAEPQRAHIHDLGQGRTLILWLAKRREMKLTDIRAFTFNTPIEVHGTNGEVYTANKGEWWFILHDGVTDMWMKTKSPNPPVDYQTAVSLSRGMIATMNVDTESALLPIGYGLSGIAAALVAVVFVAIVR